MKKKLTLTSLLVLTLLFTFSLGVLAAPNLTLYFNNKAQKTDIRLINNKPYVPLTDIATLHGSKVVFDKKANAYKVTTKGFATTPSKPTTNEFKVNVTGNSGPMYLTISKVTLDPKYKNRFGETIKAVVLDATVKNTSKSKVSWHPTQGTYAFNTGEQVDNALLDSDNLSGDFLGGAIKQGKLVLRVKDFTNINSFQVDISGAFNDSFDSLGEDLLLDVKFR